MPGRKLTAQLALSSRRGLTAGVRRAAEPALSSRGALMAGRELITEPALSSLGALITGAGLSPSRPFPRAGALVAAAILFPRADALMAAAILCRWRPLTGARAAVLSLAAGARQFARGDLRVGITVVPKDASSLAGAPLMAGGRIVAEGERSYIAGVR